MGWNPAVPVREHPVEADRLLAGGLAVAGELSLVVGGAGPHWHRPDALAALFVLGETVPLAWRRQRPRAALRVVGAATVLAAVAGYRTNLDGLSVIIAVYSYAAYRDRRSDVWPAVTVAVAVVAAVIFIDLRTTNAGSQANYAWAAAVFTLAWVIGDHLRTRRADAAALRDRADRAERDRAAEAQRAVDEERTRIARELHDVVAHALGMIAMQAGGAERVPDLDPADAKEILRSLAETSRQALGEMRRMVAVLRDDQDEAAERTPQPTVADLDSLVDHVRAAGLDATLTVEGAPRTVPSGVELSAYRIVQEALTNTVKHAGPARAQVVVRWCPDDLELEVVDDGRGAATTYVVPDASPGADGHGHGLIGMRERVSMFGGDLRVGPRPGGGFGVRARIPIGGRR